LRYAERSFENAVDGLSIGSMEPAASMPDYGRVDAVLADVHEQPARAGHAALGVHEVVGRHAMLTPHVLAGRGGGRNLVSARGKETDECERGEVSRFHACSTFERPDEFPIPVEFFRCFRVFSRG
jgi:hypothetical protein